MRKNKKLLILGFSLSFICASFFGHIPIVLSNMVINQMNEKEEGIELSQGADAILLSGAIISENEIQLKWSSVPGALSYSLYRDEVFIAEMGQGDLDEMIYTDSEVGPNQIYQYKLMANGPDLQNYFSQIEVLSLDTIPPETPLNFTYQLTELQNEVSLKWERVIESIKYELYRNQMLVAEIPNSESEIVEFLDSSAQANLIYHYEVKAVDQSGNVSEPISITAITMDTMPPEIPSYIEGKAVKANQIHLLWNPVTDNHGVSHYNVYVKSGDGEFIHVGNTYENAFIHEGLGHNREYQYKITATDINGNESQYSKIYTMKTPDDPNDIVFEKLPFAIDNNQFEIIKTLSNSIENSGR